MRVIRPLLSEIERVRGRLNDADHVLVVLDCERALSPDEAASLYDLAASDRYSLAVLSGRPVADLQERMPAGIICVGSDGLEIEGGGVSFVHRGAKAARLAIDQACCALEAALDGVRGVCVERKDLSATVHFR